MIINMLITLRQQENAFSGLNFSLFFSSNFDAHAIAQNKATTNAATDKQMQHIKKVPI